MAETRPTPVARPTRRTVLGGVAAGAAASLAPLPAADAAATSAAAATGRLRVLSGPDRHLVTRFSYGLTPALGEAVRRAGGGRRWFEQQLRPAAVPDGATVVRSWWPSLDRSPADLWKRQVDEVEGGWQVMEDYKRWLLVRRMRTGRQVHELMTEFWQHHFNVPANGDAAFTYRCQYDAVVRRHALGRFEDLLLAVTTHPAMGIYLDNARNSATRPNENLGRELLELHTVGRGSYDEDDVKASARILTGWYVDMWATWQAYYEPRRHYVGPVRVMGFSDPNVSPDGRAVTERYLRYLAHHPGTARRVARRLAVKFVADDPSPALVERLARVYLDSDTAIVPVLRALVASREFAASAGGKVRDPGEDVVATYRALGVTLSRPPAGTGEAHAADAVLWQTESLGVGPFTWQQPDGQPIDNAAWSSPSRLMNSFQVHHDMAGGWWPRLGIRYRTPRQWLPPARYRRVRRRRANGGWRWVRVRVPLQFDYWVDHLSRSVLHRPATAALLRACTEATGVRPKEVITGDHPLLDWQFPRLMATLLDSPVHLSR